MQVWDAAWKHGAWYRLSVCLGNVVTAMVVEQATEVQVVFHWSVEVRMLAIYPELDMLVFRKFTEILPVRGYANAGLFQAL